VAGLTEVALEWRSDFQLAANGDLALCDSDVETRQRLERRLFTPQKGYVWHPDYGAGLPQRIGSPYTQNQITAIVTSQIYQEASVAPFPPAQIGIDISPNQRDLVGINIKYWDAQTGVAVSFIISV
jgi:hypothetical protein